MVSRATFTPNKPAMTTASISSGSYIVTLVLSLIAVLHAGYSNHAVNGFAVLVPYSNHQRQFVATTTALFAKRVSFKEDARRGLVSGINQVANAVRVTLGPKVTFVTHSCNNDTWVICRLTFYILNLMF